MTAQPLVRASDPVHAYMTGTKLDSAATAYRFLRKRYPGLSPVESVQFLTVVLSIEEAGKIMDCKEIDAAPGQRYKDRGIASALEAFLLDEDPEAFADSEGKHLVSHPAPGLFDLCRMLGENNGMGRMERGGYLKDRRRFPFPFAWFVRLAKDIPLPGIDRLEDRLKHWLARLMPVFEAYFAFHQKAEDDGRALDLDGFKDAFPEIVAGFSVDRSLFDEPEALLTLPGYLAALFSSMEADELMGDGLERIREEHRFWREAFDSAHAVEESGRREAARLFRELEADAGDGTKENHFFATPAGPGASVVTDNEHAARFLWKLLEEKSVFLLIRTRDGHVKLETLAGAPVGLAEVHGALATLEPEYWHLEGRLESPMILNGSGIVLDVLPSLLETAEIESIIREQVVLTNLLHRSA